MYDNSPLRNIIRAAQSLDDIPMAHGQHNFGPHDDPLAPIQTWPPPDADALLCAGLAVPRPNPLTRQQVKVLQMLADGATSKLIARRLGYTVGTINNYVFYTLEMLGAANRTHAVAMALREGWIKLKFINCAKLIIRLRLR